MIDSKNLEEFNSSFSYPKARSYGIEYCNVLVINGYFPNGKKKWYWMLEGEVLMCQVIKAKRRPVDGFVKEFRCVNLSDSKVSIGRTVDVKDVIFL